MRRLRQPKGLWVGIVTIAVLGALTLWWVAASRPLSTWLPFSSDQGTENASTSDEVAGTQDKDAGLQVTSVTRKNQDVSAIIASLRGASQFNTYFKSSGVAAAIKAKPGTYTVFVPTNGAFAQLPGGTIAEMTTAERKRMIQYHVVFGRAVDVDANIAGSIQSLSGDMLNFSYGLDKIPLVNSAIVVTEYKAKNGIVYLIDNVLLPPKRSGI